MFCTNCYVDIYKYEEYVRCMKCQSLYCLNCEQHNTDFLFHTDDDKNLYKKNVLIAERPLIKV